MGEGGTKEMQGSNNSSEELDSIEGTKNYMTGVQAGTGGTEGKMETKKRGKKG